MKFGAVKDHGYSYKFYLKNYSLAELLNMAVVRNFEVLLGQTLNYFMWNSVTLCSVVY
jgi:hypothetical protein